MRVFEHTHTHMHCTDTRYTMLHVHATYPHRIGRGSHFPHFCKISFLLQKSNTHTHAHPLLKQKGIECVTGSLQENELFSHKKWHKQKCHLKKDSNYFHLGSEQLRRETRTFKLWEQFKTLFKCTGTQNLEENLSLLTLADTGGHLLNSLWWNTCTLLFCSNAVTYSSDL